MSARGVLCSLSLAALGTGCSSFSGLDAKASFACPLPDGVTCLSVTEVYGESLRNTLPGQQPGGRAPKQPPDAKPGPSGGTPAPSATAYRTAHPAPPSSGAPIRSAPRVLRIWIAPYEDSDGDLRDQSHIYVTVDPGGWEIAHTRRAIRDRFMAIRAIEPASQAAGRTPRLIDPVPLPPQAGPAAGERRAGAFPPGGIPPREER
jgi:conjugal transfer pilus assembly protein TraV